MLTPFEVYQLYVADQSCLYCPEKIGALPYYQVPDQDGFAHARCLAQEVEFQKAA